MKKSQLFVGIDVARGPGHDINTEVLHRIHPDGIIEIIGIYRWKETIELPRSSYREKEVEADNFR